MPISCTTSACQVKLPYNHFIDLQYQDYTRVISADCSKNLVVFTDDAGLIDQDDSLSGAYLSADNRRVGVFSSDDVALHWSECSRTYQELAWFFNASIGAGNRPASITVALRDSGESWVEAYSELTRCFSCFRWVTHVSHDINDDPFHDLADQITFGLLARSDRKIPIFPTADSTALTADFAETGSIPGQSGSTQSGIAWALMWHDAGCTYSCDNGATIKDWYQPDHIMLAAVGASYGFSDANYNWTAFMKPPQGWPGARTSTLSQNEIINVTGTAPSTGFMTDATRSVNVYVGSEANTSGFLEGITDNGYFIDDIAKRFAIEIDMMKAQLDFIHGATYNPGLTSEADLNKFDAIMLSKIQSYISKNIFPNRPPARIADNIDQYPDYKWSTRFSNIIAGGDGFAWVLARQPLDEQSVADQSQRFGPVYNLCFIGNRALHRPRIIICSTIKPSQIA
ncbi:MAG: hypothetical protein GKR96_04245 [Gammaproteobacteria bacterium]|nr:hypothetical protein [Gammaproteobacteria bacterium]